MPQQEKAQNKKLQNIGKGMFGGEFSSASSSSNNENFAVENFTNWV